MGDGLSRLSKTGVAKMSNKRPQKPPSNHHAVNIVDSPSTLQFEEIAGSGS
jgi:hypothetical protein